MAFVGACVGSNMHQTVVDIYHTSEYCNIVDINLKKGFAEKFNWRFGMRIDSLDRKRM